MHSVISFGALALGLLSMTGSAFASEAGAYSRSICISICRSDYCRLVFVTAGDVSHLVARQNAPRPRGRPNHALEYGYPHRRGDHSGTRAPPPPADAPPMTPGGYVDPRPANTGAVCRHSMYSNRCPANSELTFVCLAQTTSAAQTLLSVSLAALVALALSVCEIALSPKPKLISM